MGQWTPRRLGDLVDLASGASPSGFTFSSTGTPYFKVEQLGRASKFVDGSDTPYFARDAPQIASPSVLIAKRGAAIALNRVCVTREPCFMDTNVMALTPRGEIDAEFLYYWLTNRGLWDIADVASVPQINNKHIKPLCLQLPDLAEQEAIAKVLSSYDEVLLVLERLIAKREAIKQGLLQELLTGRTRLPGFDADWTGARFDEVAGLVRDRALPTTVESSTTLVELEHIDNSSGSLLGSGTAGDAVSLKAVFRSGDVLFGKLRSYLRKYWLASGPGLCSTEIWVLRARDGNVPAFVRYLVETGQFISAASEAHGTHMPRADWSVVGALQVDLPTPAEQAAIAAVLSNADAELAALRTRLEKAKAVRQGVMQELLTGRMRLPVPAPDDTPDRAGDEEAVTT